MRRRSRRKIYKKIYRKLLKRQTALIVSVAVSLSAGLTTFEYLTGLPASLRSDPIYNSLPIPEAHTAAPEETTAETLLMERICERVVRNFSGDISLLTRVNERIRKRFGFSCN